MYFGVRRQDGSARFIRHWLDVDEITVVIVHDEHVGISAGGRLDEPPGEVVENLTRWRGTIGVDVVLARDRRRGDGWREVSVVGRERGVDGGRG